MVIAVIELCDIFIGYMVEMYTHTMYFTISFCIWFEGTIWEGALM